ncbi:hypothetical protein [Limnoglobus roseus]|uniref:Uncharacterized protein n=1 Tax=Limnoglobus roseus TaxID=2598579 RepID=A0A5C1AH88_9BACT|nr:hypothetical protein [Limnoglobus roseus]QEL18180.1 hypothetical protein PX52LOC_05194 [Limnoglobus roseus]
MRTVWTVTILLTLPAFAAAQTTAAKVAPRYGIAINTRTFTQTTAKETLTSAIKAVEENRFDVLVAHLIDPKVTEARAAENGRLLENEVEKDLQQVREKQRANPINVASEEKLPFEPMAFAQFVKAEAKVRGFKAAIEEVRQKFAGDTSLIPEMKRFLRDGDFTNTPDGAKVTLKDAKGKAIFFTKVNDRWFIEDRKEDATKDEKK